MLLIRSRPGNSGSRRAFTLIELMIAIVISVIVLGVMMRAFTRASREISKGRSIMELAAQLRSVGEMLRSDFDNVTMTPRVWNSTADAFGYFEVVDGFGTDTTRNGTAVDYFGDIDDVLAMTVKSTGRPFRGRYQGGVIESPLAEVVWFVNRVDVDNAGFDSADRVTLYRKVLLIRPDLDLSGFSNLNTFWVDNDVSARDSGGSLRSNSLADLTVRENRFSRAAAFPNAITNLVGKIFQGNYEGDDIIMSDMAAFDVRVYSPNATVYVNTSNSHVVEPGDVGYPLPPAAGTAMQQGAFVDLGYNDVSANAWFSGAANTDSQLTRTWCNWTPFYEYDGQDQDGDTLIDEGTDGVDNDGANGADDEGERETQPPYPNPIRAIEVTIRAVEKSEGTVRQVTIVHSFVPE